MVQLMFHLNAIFVVIIVIVRKFWRKYFYSNMYVVFVSTSNQVIFLFGEFHFRSHICCTVEGNSKSVLTWIFTHYCSFHSKGFHTKFRGFISLETFSYMDRLVHINEILKNNLQIHLHGLSKVILQIFSCSFKHSLVQIPHSLI